jgi:aconitate hydratase 2 / 2-methylisocitrate dehydratase
MDALILTEEGSRRPRQVRRPYGNAELAAMCALAGRIVTVAEYMEQIKLVNAKAGEVYRYMNFDQIPAFVEQAATVEM